MTAKQPDWEAIERAYRAGALSIRTIADRNGVSDTAIRKKACSGQLIPDTALSLSSATAGASPSLN